MMARFLTRFHWLGPILQLVSFASGQSTPAATITLKSPPSPDVPLLPLLTGCTKASLTAPYLDIKSFRQEAPHTTENVQGLVEFDVYNPMIKATSYCSAEYSLPNSRIPATDCVPDNRAGKQATVTTFAFDNSGSGRLVVNQTWTCDDSRKQTPFVGIGTIELGSEKAWSQGGRVWLSLSKPVSLKPVIPAPPAGHDTRGCAAKSSETLSWTVAGFDWRTGFYQLPPGPIMGGMMLAGFSMRFNLTNSANGVHKLCNLDCRPAYNETTYLSNDVSYFSDPSRAYENKEWCSCQNLMPSADTNDSYIDWTYLHFNPYFRRLYISQTWYCDGVDDGHKAIQFNARGEVDLPPLQCLPRASPEPDSDRGGNDWDHMPGFATLVGGQKCTVNRTTTHDDEFLVNGTVASRYELERPDALQLPKPVRRSCTMTSLGLAPDEPPYLNWSVEGFSLSYHEQPDGRSGPGNWSNGGLNIWLSGLEGRLVFNHWGGTNQTVDLDSDFLFTSTADPYEDKTELGHNVTGFARYNLDTNSVSLNISWVCNERNRETP
ncbi:hypothetical protein B0H66DRAFT_585317 [Apodospora peruviana]|uniref:Uncharacterized protein n=1 Tax=Apodospora peruviana TaxID=516989 RepID=A0AAE0IPD0_9PEZI|nr:hypothetical protein B0H66DRAFT_585317 [Apodospora peruviana]